MKSQINIFITNPLTVISVIVISAVLTYLVGGTGFLFGLAAVLITLWSSGFKWSLIGINKPDWFDTILKAIEFAIAIFIIVDIIIQPLIEWKTGNIDLSGLDGIRGNLLGYLVFTLFMWVVAGFGEEFFYRGFVVKQLAAIFGDNNKAWLISISINAVLFGLAHMYQGYSGVITTGIIGFILGLIFYSNKQNLFVAILTHGFYDMIGITLIYLDSERVILDWVISLLSS